MTHTAQVGQLFNTHAHTHTHKKSPNAQLEGEGEGDIEEGLGGGPRSISTLTITPGAGGGGRSPPKPKDRSEVPVCVFHLKDTTLERYSSWSSSFEEFGLPQMIRLPKNTLISRAQLSERIQQIIGNTTF